MRRAAKYLLPVLLLLLVSWLGETLFNTKGEPREAIVAVSMLQSGDWVLPVSYGADIPYKPPLLAWLIALFSLVLNGGIVNEFTSRLPSALAAIALVMSGFCWARRWKGTRFALLMAVVTVTSFEVLRAAVACRVDMVLTACMVIPLYLLYNWRRAREDVTGRWWQPVMATLLLSGAVLAKGPVGALLPCLAFGIYCLVRRDNFFATVGWLTAVCLASMVLPALWYYAAWQQGGQAFLDLAWEENIGRLTGTMGYDSHLNPWYYNIITIIAGMLPWTLLALLGAFSWRRMWRGRRPMTDAGVFMTVVALTVFVFYCLPASKRSVYLLPMYPALAYAVAALMEALSPKGTEQGRWNAVGVFADFLGVAAIVAPVVAVALQWMPLRHLPVEAMPLWRYVFPVACIAAGIAYFRNACGLRRSAFGACALTLVIFLAYLAAFQPMLLNGKSDKCVAPAVAEALEQGPVYSLNEDSLMRQYTLNFYLGDRLRRLPEEGDIPAGDFAVLVSDRTLPLLGERLPMTPDTVLLMPKSCDTRRPLILARYKQP